jgi:hypothetical protein
MPRVELFYYRRIDRSNLHFEMRSRRSAIDFNFSDFPEKGIFAVPICFGGSRSHIGSHQAIRGDRSHVFGGQNIRLLLLVGEPPKDKLRKERLMFELSP